MEARLNGIDVYYERQGSGRRLLFCNGSGSSIDSTRALIDVFASRFDVVVHDQRGLGRTEVPAGPYTMADYAADAAALLDHLGWASCRTVGISFGGMVAQELAVTWPERIERLALLCTSPGGSGGKSYPLHELAAKPPAEQLEIGMKILDSRFTATWLDEHPSDRALVEMMAERRGGTKDERQVAGERGQLDARRAHDVCDRLHLISCPTLVACGKYDGIAPPANGEFIAAHVPDAELRTYDGGHAFFVQDRQALPDVLDFLDGPD
jgi:pimeloyl-ACP methyl ester carboxylesterase